MEGERSTVLGTNFRSTAQTIGRSPEMSKILLQIERFPVHSDDGQDGGDRNSGDGGDRNNNRNNDGDT